MRESLRLGTTLPARMVEALEDTEVLDGRHTLKKGEVILCGNFIVHRDPKTWGDDVSRLHL